MVIHINPQHIPPSSGRPGRYAGRRPESRAAAIPRRAPENHFPSPESLATLIGGAIEALKRGVRWDRGTILNLLV